MLRWIPFVMVRVVFFFAAGILLGVYLPGIMPAVEAAYLLISSVGIYFLQYFIFRKRRKVLTGVLGLLSLFIAGFVHVSFFTASNDTDHLLNYDGKVSAYQAMVSAIAEDRENSIKYELQLLRISDGGQWQKRHGKILLYVSKIAEAQDFFYGDVLMIHGAPSELDPPANPFEFDYKRFLGFNNIYHQHFVRSADEMVLQERESKRGILFFSYKARLWARDQLVKYIPGQREQAIALALVLGVKEGIDNELQTAYASSGAMHVLAVSGLHVGIIYSLILLIFKPFQHKSSTRWFLAIASILLLWAYAFVTGLSPSVLRAVTMFSFIAIARPFGRSTNIYNTLAGSAFMLLIFNPYLIMSVGFQLSYLAVLGIVTIHRPLYMLLEPRFFILDWIWNISCVSIAAQLATFSLGILYFHQFPVYFLFSNLFVIPGAIIILVGGIVLLFVSLFAPIAVFIGGLLQYFIQVLNSIVFAVEELPFSLIEQIYLTTLQCWILLGVLILMIVMLKYRTFAPLVVASSLAVGFSISQWLHFTNEVSGNRLVVYNVSGHTAIELMSNGSSQFFTDMELANDLERIRFHITPNRLNKGINKQAVNYLSEDLMMGGVKIWNYEGKAIGLVSSPLSSWPDGLELDFLIVANNSFKSLNEARSLINFSKMILDSSNKRWLSAKIASGSVEEVVHDVQGDGAFVIKL